MIRLLARAAAKAELDAITTRRKFTLSFDAFDEAGAPRVFAGMWRPPYETLTEDERRSLIPAGSFVVPIGHERTCWLAGDLDRPLYIIEESP